MRRIVLPAARLCLYLYLFALPLMQPPLAVAGFLAAPPDLLFLALAGLAALILLTRGLPLPFDPAFAFMAAYFAAMTLSALTSADPLAAAPKLATQLYLLSIPVMVVLLVRDTAMLRAACRWWLAGSAAVVLVALASLALFALDPSHPLLAFTSFHFGTLPPGHYPRLSLTFLNANLACNYLSVSLLILLAAGRAGWIGGLPLALLLPGILAGAATTISPGLGGVVLALGLWLSCALRSARPLLARSILLGGLALASLSLVAATVTPILHSTAPFLIPLPFTDLVLAPSGRLMIWVDAFRNFLDAPWTGRGIGSEAVEVRYLSPSGDLQRLTDAHNMFLSIAVQCGLIGLLALLALLLHLSGRTGPLRLPASPAGTLRLGLGLALLVGLVFQGLTGSFEDARHLWATLGLFLAASRIERGELARDPPVRDRRPGSPRNEDGLG